MTGVDVDRSLPIAAEVTVGGKHTSLALSVVLRVSLGSRRLGLSAGSAWEAERENLPVARDIEPACGGQNGHEMP
jgi:hypothetical protein